MTSKHYLYVCIRCQPEESAKAPITAGEELFKNLSHALKNTPLARHFEIQPIACMNGCRRACTVGLVAPNKVSYLFGDLTPDTPPSAVFETAALYASKPDGIVKKIERPLTMRDNVLARIPPLPRGV